MSEELRENEHEENRLNHGSPGYGLQIGPNSEPTLRLQELSAPWIKRGNVKSAIGHLSNFVGLPYWRCYEIWLGRARTIKPYELKLIADAVQKKNEEDARNELQSLKTRIAILETRLNPGDEEFRGADIDALSAQTCGSGGVGGAMKRRRG